MGGNKPYVAGGPNPTRAADLGLPVGLVVKVAASAGLSPYLAQEEGQEQPHMVKGEVQPVHVMSVYHAEGQKPPLHGHAL